MKRTIILVAGFILAFTIVSQAQDKNDPKHENHFKQLKPLDTDEYTVTFSDAHCQMTFCTVKLKIKNKTKDYLYFFAAESQFKFDFGDVSPKEKVHLIAPGKSKTVVLKVTGEHNFHVEKYSLELKGFYIASSSGSVINTERFQLPPNLNSFEAGPYKVNLLQHKQETQETAVKFKATYTGKKIGLINPSNAIASTEKGEFANQFRKAKVKILEQNESDKFTILFKIPGKVLDMQFATFHIDWKNTFRETERNGLNGYEFDMELDPGLTHGKNK